MEKDHMSVAAAAVHKHYFSGLWNLFCTFDFFLELDDHQAPTSHKGTCVFVTMPACRRRPQTYWPPRRQYVAALYCRHIFYSDTMATLSFVQSGRGIERLVGCSVRHATLMRLPYAIALPVCGRIWKPITAYSPKPGTLMFAHPKQCALGTVARGKA